MTKQKRFPWLAVILGAGCVGILCVGFLVIGGGAAFFLTQRSVSPSMPKSVVTVQVVTLEILPTATLTVPSPAPVPTDSPPEIKVLSIGETYNQAPSIAQKWRSDAQLIFAEFDFSVNGYPDCIMGFYEFLSLSSNKLLSIAIDKTGAPQIQFEDDWPQDSPTVAPIFIQDLHLETQQALAIIMENGGY